VSPNIFAACELLAGMMRNPAKIHTPSRTAELVIIGCVPKSKREATDPMLRHWQRKLQTAESLGRHI
jgi:hypothetical protein